MKGVRRTGPPQRLPDRSRFGIPIEGDVDGIWQRALRARLTEEIGDQLDLPGGEFFGRSLTVNPGLITFHFNGDAEQLPRFLDMVAAAIPAANAIADAQRQTMFEAGAEAERKVHDRDEDIEREMNTWVERQPTIDPARA
jgi:hypothetical protein